MEDLESLLDAHARRSADDDADLSASVSVKMSPDDREAFWTAAKEMGVPRRILAGAIFAYGMKRIRKQISVGDLVKNSVSEQHDEPRNPAAVAAPESVPEGAWAQQG